MHIHAKKPIEAVDRKVIATLLKQTENISWLFGKERPVVDPESHLVHWDFIRGGDGKIRWIYPSQSRRPHFLSTYNSPTPKARIYRWVVQLCFFLGLRSWVRSGRLDLVLSPGAYPSHLPFDLAGGAYGIFTGTVGPNRKAVVALAQEGRVTQFAKLAIGEQAAARLQHEVKAQDQVRELGLQHWQVPTGVRLNQGASLLENIQGQSAPGTAISPLQVKAIFEMTERTLERDRKLGEEFIETIKERIEALQSGEQLPGMGRLTLRLQQLLEQARALPHIPFAYAHGDFTPWNMYVGEDALQVYDWEMAGKRPALFDLFHYAFQTGVLVRNQEYAEIRHSLADVMGRQQNRQRLHRFGLEPRALLRLYLLETVSFNLRLFQEQEHLHTQAWWLMRCWAKALEVECEGLSAPACRRVWLREFPAVMQPLRAALMRGARGPLEAFPDHSDLDLLTDRPSQKTLSDWASQHPLVTKSRLFKQSFMQRLEIHFVDGGFLSLDLITDLRRKNLRMMPAEVLLDLAVTDVFGVRRLRIQDQLEYALLFYGLNRHPLPGRSLELFQSLPLAQRMRFSEVMNQRYGRPFPLEFDAEYAREHARQLKQHLRRLPCNDLVSRPGMSLLYLRDVCRRFFQDKGLVITFSGVDGAGKSTVLASTAGEIEGLYRRKVKVLRHRPSLLPILSSIRHGRKGAQEKAANTLPRQGGNRNPLSSFLRFSWYYVDYLIGQWYIWLRYERRGYVVLYDRYFFDMIADPERTNFRLPSGMLKLASRLIRKPDLNFLLTADPEEIRKRKQELELADIQLLTHRYRSLFREMSEQEKSPRFITLHNLKINSSVDRVLQAYRQAL